MSSFIHLPLEILRLILSNLSNRDIKNLRRTCSTLAQRAHLRLNRVFLSANPRNIEVCRAIADHETFRYHIVEIVWDDARLIDNVQKPEFEFSDDEEDWEEAIKSNDGIPWWFKEAYEKNIRAREIRKISHKTDPSIHLSWEFYEQLLQQQKAVLESDDDVRALRYGLQRFPRLTRVTLTPVAHGVLDVPLYETPMIRSFPPKFNYPIPHTWPPYDLKNRTSYSLEPWNKEGKRKWRGFCVIRKELSEFPTHTVSEFVVDTHTLHQTGLSCRLFEQPCEEYDNLVSLLQRPGFKHLDLTFLADGQCSPEQNWSSFRSGLFKKALDALPSDLRHFSLQINVNYERARHLSWPSDDSLGPEHFIPLKTILPAVNEKWKKLKHFGLSGLLVRGDELLSVLADLSTSVRSVELSHLVFLHQESNGYHELLVGIRDRLGWTQRAMGERPVLTLHHRWDNIGNMDYYCYDKAANGFLYHGGMDPFRTQRVLSPVPFLQISPFHLYSDNFELLEILP